MNNEYKVRGGFRVRGPNTRDGVIDTWYFPTLELAQGFAKEMIQQTKAEYDILKFIGSMRRIPLAYVYPTEWVPSKDGDEKCHYWIA